MNELTVGLMVGITLCWFAMESSRGEAVKEYSESVYRAARYKPELDAKGIGVEPVDVQRDAALDGLLKDAGKRYDAIAAKYPGERVRRKVWGYQMLDLFDEPGVTRGELKLEKVSNGEVVDVGRISTGKVLLLVEIDPDVAWWDDQSNQAASKRVSHKAVTVDMYRDLYERYAGKDVLIVPVWTQRMAKEGTDRKASAQAYLNKHKIPGELLMDKDGALDRYCDLQLSYWAAHRWAERFRRDPGVHPLGTIVCLRDAEGRIVYRERNLLSTIGGVRIALDRVLDQAFDEAVRRGFPEKMKWPVVEGRDGGILFRDNMEQYGDSYAFQTDPRWGFTYDDQAFIGQRGEIAVGDGVTGGKALYVNARWKFDYEIGHELGDGGRICPRSVPVLSFPYVLKDGYVSFKVRRGAPDGFEKLRDDPEFRNAGNPAFVDENKQFPGFQIMVSGITFCTNHLKHVQKGVGITGYERDGEDFYGDDQLKFPIPVGRICATGKWGQEPIAFGTSFLHRNLNYPKVPFTLDQWHTITVRCAVGRLATLEIDGRRIGQLDSETLTCIQFWPWFSMPGYFVDDVEIFYAQPPSGFVQGSTPGGPSIQREEVKPDISSTVSVRKPQYYVPPQDLVKHCADSRNWWPRVVDMEMLDIPDDRVDMVRLPGGVVTLGNPAKPNPPAFFYEAQVPPGLSVTVNAFHVSKFPISCGQYRHVFNWALKNGYTFDQHDKHRAGHQFTLIMDDGLDPRHSARIPDWYDRVKFCNALSEMEGRTPCYYTDASHREVYRRGRMNLDVYDTKWDATGYRLPTEAEWNYYVRGGMTTRNFWGDSIFNPKFAWTNLCEIHFPAGVGGLQRLGLFEPNRFGLFDLMTMYEWTTGYSAFWDPARRDNPKGGTYEEGMDAEDYINRQNTLGALNGWGLWFAGMVDNWWPRNPTHPFLGAKHEEFGGVDIFKIGAHPAETYAPDIMFRVIRADAESGRGSYSMAMWEKKDPATVKPPVSVEVKPANLPEAGDLLLLVDIPSGKFRMGGARTRPNMHGELWVTETPVREVSVKSFWMGKTEVTRGQWKKVHAWAKQHGYEFQEIELWTSERVELIYTVGAVSDEHPITYISWYDAVRWCNAASEMEGRRPCYYLDADKKEVFRKGHPDLEKAQVDWSANGYRLPTEAEWEYACRGGSPAKYFWGDDFDPQYGRHHLFERVGSFHMNKYFYTKVASYRPNAFGLYDTANNAFEWCWDWLGAYEADAVDNPMGCDGAVSQKTHQDLHDERTRIYGGYPRVAEVNLVENEFAVKGVHEEAEKHRAKPDHPWPAELKLRHQRRVLRGGLEYGSGQRYGNDPLWPKHDQGFRVAVSKR